MVGGSNWEDDTTGNCLADICQTCGSEPSPRYGSQQCHSNADMTGLPCPKYLVPLEEIRGWCKESTEVLGIHHAYMSDLYLFDVYILPVPGTLPGTWYWRVPS